MFEGEDKEQIVVQTKEFNNDTLEMLIGDNGVGLILKIKHQAWELNGLMSLLSN